MLDSSKKKCRQYKSEYLKLGFIQCPTNKSMPLCLICERTFTNEAMNPSRLQEHLKKAHPDKFGKDLTYFSELEKKFTKRPSLHNIFDTSCKQSYDGIHASYKIALLIAKAGKPHTIGEELILPAMKEILTTVLHKPAENILKSISLSNSTVQRRIDEMAEEVESSLCGYLKTTKFSIQLNESTLPNNESILLSFVRFLKDEKPCEELLFAKSLATDCKGITIYSTLQSFFLEKNIPLNNIISVATDGAPAMIGQYNGFTAHLKQAVPNILTVHCVIHRQHLVAQNLSLRLHDSLGFVIKAVNKIRNSALNDRLFGQLCIENDEDFNRLLYHTEVRWLSKGSCLSRFYNLFDIVLQFLDQKDTELSINLSNYKSDIAYLTDLYRMYNDVNLQLQGDDLNLIKTKNIISAFIKKLQLYKRQLKEKNFNFFQNLSLLSSIVTNYDLMVYCEHLEELYADFNRRFRDILNMAVPEWVIDPYESELNIANTRLEEELIELTTNEELKIHFKKGYQQFWLQKPIPKLYPGLWNIVQVFLIAFPSSYLPERGFSACATIFSKKRSRISITERGDLRLYLTKFEPDVEKFMKKHQIHPSH